MTLTEVLEQEAESMYRTTEALFRRVEPGCSRGSRRRVRTG